MIADDFDAIRARLRELQEARHPLKVFDFAAGQPLVIEPGTVYVDTSAGFAGWRLPFGCGRVHVYEGEDGA